MKTLSLTANAVLLMLILPASFCGRARAQTTDQRVALVIGNGQYETGTPLLNPGNDARAMSKALRETGFEVMEYIDLETQADMKRAVRDFGRKIQDGGVGLFYYAGHGIQVAGKNYLVPTKAKIYAEEEVEYEALDAGFVLAQMEIARNRMNILILDACRNNPFGRSWRSGSQGLAMITAPTGTLIAYATSPGSVASDGDGENGRYTAALLVQMRKEGMKIEDVFKNVRADVLRKSNNEQTPWETSSLVGDFYFVRNESSEQADEAFARLEKTEVLSEIKDPTSDENQGKGGKEEALVFRNSGTSQFRHYDGRYWFYQNGSDVTSECAAVETGEDALLYHKTTNKNYLLRGYMNIKDRDMHPAEELSSSSNAFWRWDGTGTYWFYVEGYQVAHETNNAYYEDHLVVYHNTSGKYYYCHNYKNSEAYKLHAASQVYSPNNTLWWANATHYYFYLDGNQIGARTFHRWRGNDLIIYDETTSSSWLLKDYYHNKDKKLRPAEILAAPNKFTWSHLGSPQQFNMYRDGDEYPIDAVTAYSNKDLLVYDRTGMQTYLLENYQESGITYQWAKILISRSNAVWRRQGNNYFLYVEAVLQTINDVTAEIVGNDLEVTHLTSGVTWVLPNYMNLNDNTLRAAVLKQ